MTRQTAGVFTIEYTLFTRAEPDHDIQFGMDFTLTSTVKEPLTQLIFPAVAVGNNKLVSGTSITITLLRSSSTMLNMGRLLTNLGK